MHESPRRSLKKPNILIVDDNPSNLELLQALLQAEGYAVVSAADGSEALPQVAIPPRRSSATTMNGGTAGGIPTASPARRSR